MDNIQAMSDITNRKRLPIFGALSLIAFCVGIFVGIATAMVMISGTEEMASLGAGLASIAVILMACIPSFVFAVIGLFRKEKPMWPAVVGFVLSVIPGGLGLRILVEILVDCFKHILKI